MVADLDVPAHFHAGGRSHQYVISQVFDFCIVVAVFDPCGFSIEAGGDGLVVPIQRHPEQGQCAGQAAVRFNTRGKECRDSHAWIPVGLGLKVLW